MMADVQRKKAGVACFSVISSTVPVIPKVLIGVWIGSVVDPLASIINLYSTKTSGKGTDSNTPFGQGKGDDTSCAVEALITRG